MHTEKLRSAPIPSLLNKPANATTVNGDTHRTIHSIADRANPLSKPYRRTLTFLLHFTLSPIRRMPSIQPKMPCVSWNSIWKPQWRHLLQIRCVPTSVIQPFWPRVTLVRIEPKHKSSVGCAILPNEHVFHQARHRFEWAQRRVTLKFSNDWTIAHHKRKSHYNESSTLNFQPSMRQIKTVYLYNIKWITCDLTASGYQLVNN